MVVGETRVTLGVPAQPEGERRQIEARLQRHLQEIARMEARLANPGFTDKAPGPIVEQERVRLRQAQEAASRLRELLGSSAE